MARTVIIFGARGFIGRRVAAALTADGWRCIGVDRYGRTTGGVGDINGPYYSGNDWSPVALRRFLRRCGPAAIVNAVGASWSTDPAVLRRDNVLWPCRLGEACEVSGSTESILHIGSSHEYGATAPGVPVSESSGLAPVTEYGRSKTAGASYLIRAACRMNSPATVVRAFNVIGPGHSTYGIWALAVGLYRAAAEAGADRVVANVPYPETARDLVDVRDVARLVCLAAGRGSGASVATYNAGSGTATSIRQLFDAFTEQTGIPYRFVRSPVDLRIGSAWQRADVSHAESRLGWMRDFTLADSIRACLALDEPAATALV